LKVRGIKFQKMGHKKDADVKIVWVLRVVIILFIAALIISQSKMVVSDRITLVSNGIPKAFVGYRIAHISDMCNSGLSVTNKVKKFDPNIIVISGGFEDSNGKAEKSLKEVNKLCNIAPVYYVYSGNDTSDNMSNSNAVLIQGEVIELEPINKSAEDLISKIYGDEIIELAESGDEEAQQYMEYLDDSIANSNGMKLIGTDRHNGETGVQDSLNQVYNLLDSKDTDYTIGLIGTAKTIPNIAEMTNLNMALTGGTYGSKTISDIYTKGLYDINGTQTFICGGLGSCNYATGKETIRVLNFPQIQLITLSDGSIPSNNPIEKLIGKVFKDVGHIYENDGGPKLKTYKY